MPQQLEHLGPFSDLAPLAIRANKLFPPVRPGLAASKKFLAALNFNPRTPTPLQLRVEKRWEADGVAGEALSWSVGHGPRTQAWLLRPAGVKGKLPGVLLLHDHGGYKFYGKEKVADGPDGKIAAMVPFRAEYYSELPVANELAKRGFAVLVHDTFMWGSRKFPVEQLLYREDLKEIGERAAEGAEFPEIEAYNALAAPHESIVEKYAHVLGTTVGGIVNFDDRVALSVLAGRRDVHADRVACMGLSGGGMRTVLMQATSPALKAAVVIGAMMTYPSLLDTHVVKHTWMLYPPAFSRLGDWSDAVACRAPSALMVQYCLQDPLYTVKGMKDAHRRIGATYRRVGAAKNYRGMFYPTTHQFNRPMQADAFAFLEAQLKPRSL